MSTSPSQSLISPSTTVRPKITSTDDSTSSDDNTTKIIIGASVGGILFVVLLCLILLYCHKRKHSPTRKQHNQKDSATNSTLVNLSSQTGFVNQALQSSQDIEVGMPPATQRDNTLIKPVEIEPDRVQLVSDHRMIKDLDELCYDISIKLMTPWDEIYTKIDSQQYTMMKDLVQNSIEDLYIEYNDFRGAALQKFRHGSVIADIRMSFTHDAVHPLCRIKKAVKGGQFSKLEVDKKFFQESLVQAPPTRKVPETEILSETNHQSFEEAFSGSLSRSQRMESGYGSQYGSQHFDASVIAEKLKVREISQRSSASIESNTSEVGTSHSISPKSLSSTNISIQSNGNEDDEPPKREKGLFHGIVKRIPDFKHHWKQQTKLAIPHIALFNFSPQDFRELALEKGDLITVIVIDDGGWVKAVNEKGKEGWVPHNFVTPFDQKQYDHTVQAVDSLMYLDGVIDSIDVTLNSPQQEVMKLSPRTRIYTEQEEQINDHKGDSVTGRLSELFVTIYPNDPTEINELKLELGDTVDVLKTSETGWWKGRSLRTYETGWFPSSYVRPQASGDLDICELLEDRNDKGSVSDSEVHARSLAFHKRSKQQQKQQGDGYTSDDGISRSCETKINDHLKEPSLNHAQRDNDQSQLTEYEKEDKEAHYKDGRTQPNRSSIVISIDKSNEIENDILPVTIETVDPPCKPVPPKPRKSHIMQTFRNLAAEGKLGSTESLVTRSTECLATYDRIANGARRNSAEIVTDDETYGRGFARTKPIDRLRPRSFQETPKTSFLYLANRYASSMKAAWSFPTLVGDQLNLSPEDERPYLVPIPRKSRRKSMPIDEIRKDIEDSTDEKSRVSKKPVSRSSSCSSTGEMTLSGHTVYVNISTDSSPLESISVPFKPLPPQPDTLNKSEVPAKSMKPVIAPKPSLPDSPPLLHSEVLLAEKIIRPSISPKPPNVPIRSSSKKFAEDYSNLIKEKVCPTSPTRLSEQHTRHGSNRLRNTSHFLFSSFESINEETEQANTPSAIDNKHKKTDHRRYHSEPHDGSYNAYTINAVREHLKTIPSDSQERLQEDMDSPRSPSPPPINGSESSSNITALSPPSLNEKTLRKHDKLHELSPNSRTSSMQSLNSLASSRSTSSTKHEQMYLRKAVMDVYGQGTNDLSFKAGAILYELRPRNKDGYCYGLLEDSTQGFYPAAAVLTLQYV